MEKKLFGKMYIFKILIAGFASIIILSIILFMYSYVGFHKTNYNETTDYKWNPNQIIVKMNEGFAINVTDINGYNNKDNNIIEPEILLMGSSHMEGFNVLFNNSVGKILNEKYSTYNIGISGHQIYHCVKNIKKAVNYHKPKNIVIIETDEIDLGKEEMYKVVKDELESIKSYDNAVLGFLQKYFPAVKSIYQGIDDWRKVELRKNSNKDIEKEYDQKYIELLNEFIKKANEPVKENQNKLIIFYHPNSKIDREGKLIDTTNPEALKLFKNACDENEVIFIDMTEEFKKIYVEESKLAHGFSNTAIGVGHLNRYGHKIIAKTLLDTINKLEEEK